jgi:hypothetical protein
MAVCNVQYIFVYFVFDFLFIFSYYGSKPFGIARSVLNSASEGDSTEYTPSAAKFVGLLTNNTCPTYG